MSTSSIDLVHSAFSAFVLFSFPVVRPSRSFQAALGALWLPRVFVKTRLGVLYIFENFREVVRIFENSMTMGSQKGKYHTFFPGFCLWAAIRINFFFVDLAFRGLRYQGPSPLAREVLSLPPNLARLMYALPSYRYTDSIDCFRNTYYFILFT